MDRGREDAAEVEAEERFLAAVIAYFAQDGASFEADLIYEAEVEDLEAAARESGVALQGGGKNVLTGPLVSSLAQAFPAHTQLVLTVWIGGTERLHVHDDVEEVYVYLGDDEVDALLSALAMAGFTLERQAPYRPSPDGHPDSPWADAALGYSG